MTCPRCGGRGAWAERDAEGDIQIVCFSGCRRWLVKREPLPVPVKGFREVSKVP